GGTVLATFITRKVMGFDHYGILSKKAKDTTEEQSDAAVAVAIEAAEGAETKSDKTLLLTIFIPVAIGIISGFLFLPDWFINASGTIIVVGLSILLFFVGIDLGIEGTIVQNFKMAGWRVTLFPFVMILGTYIGSIVAGLIVDLSVKDSLCVASGFGWYTLAPAMLAEYSIEISAISFMHNVMRELMGLLLMPVVAKRIGHIETTGLVGAGSMDVCLPIIVRTTSSNMAVYAFIVGVVLSTAVPIMVSFMMGL
ncbi:MAG: lysine exporter LysO family protein, partial [Bacillota bacterium]|nr:lysine exporter LysO family protein [Bacillota bacterium]